MELKFGKKSISQCPLISPYLRHYVKIIQNPIPDMENMEQNFAWIQQGGLYKPKECYPKQKIAIIVPFRNRSERLLLFLLNIHPFLKRQQRHYQIFVVEQNGTDPFNRGYLMNVGFKEALKRDRFDCFIFHDVDMVPEDDRNLYSCADMPKHLAIAISNRHYRLPFSSYFGGVNSISREHYEFINGFANRYWGWGSEDDDIRSRILYHNFTIYRYFDATIARYTALKHSKAKMGVQRVTNYINRAKYYNNDGLNNLNYTVIDLKQYLLYTWILAKLDYKAEIKFENN